MAFKKAQPRVGRALRQHQVAVAVVGSVHKKRPKANPSGPDRRRWWRCRPESGPSRRPCTKSVPKPTPRAPTSGYKRYTRAPVSILEGAPPTSGWDFSQTLGASVQHQVGTVPKFASRLFLVVSLLSVCFQFVFKLLLARF